VSLRYLDLGLRGRLGNALFELASSIGVARRRGELIGFNPGWLHRRWFSVDDRYFHPRHDAVDAWTVPELDHIDERARPYMQDVALFADVKDEIRILLAPSAQAERILDDCTEFHALTRPVLSVHVRRGDNIVDPGVRNKSDYHVTPPLAWYQRAIEMQAPLAASVAVFSDDQEWARANIDADYYHEGVTRPKEHESDYLTAPVLDWVDVQLMALASLHIVSGSTFGIWGALLARSNDVVRPDRVYGPMLSFINSELLFPSEWRTLRFEDC
jgi:hypothetical protein